MYLLDANTTSDFLDLNRNYEALRARVLSVPYKDLYVPVIAIIENLDGLIGWICRNRNDPRLVRLCAEFQSTVHDLAEFQIAPWDDAAKQVFDTIPAAHRRRHARDCRIAAIALSRGFTVVTRNIKDFQPTGVKCVSWH